MSRTLTPTAKTLRTGKLEDANLGFCRDSLRNLAHEGGVLSVGASTLSAPPATTRAHATATYATTKGSLFKDPPTGVADRDGSEDELPLATRCGGASCVRPAPKRAARAPPATGGISPGMTLARFGSSGVLTKAVVTGAGCSLPPRPPPRPRLAPARDPPRPFECEDSAS